MFDLYAFADYSGSLREVEQRKRIALSVIRKVDRAGESPETRVGFTRKTLLLTFRQMLQQATECGERVVFGFDHNYSFPIGFYEAVTGHPWTNWRQVLRLLAEGKVAEDPRGWARMANLKVARRFELETDGPFWGPHFEPRKKPDFPYEEILRERRLVEERCPRMKTVFQLGGAGSVGLQSLFGMFYLHQLLLFCDEAGIQLHCWPFDGMEIPSKGHVLVEMYPTLFNQGQRTDQKDAEECAVWLAEQDKLGCLQNWLEPDLDHLEKERVALEGWALGV
ncbi:MAG TPA: hypothetical protein VF199_10410 [Bacillales bacterium]